MSKTASVYGRSILITTGESKLLVLEVGLDCPDCGQHSFRLAGHHLRTLKALLDSVIEANPDLVGTTDSTKIVDQYE